MNSLVTLIGAHADQVINRWREQLGRTGVSPSDPKAFADAARRVLAAVAARADEVRGRTDAAPAQATAALQAYAAARCAAGPAPLIRDWQSLRAALWQSLSEEWTALPVTALIEEQAALNFALDETLAQIVSTRAEPARAAERAAFNQQLAIEIERAARYGRSCSLAILDIDRLRVVNEKLGQEAGDRLLAGLAALLRREIRQADRSFRYGGDEFVVILPEADFAAAGAVMRRLGERAASLWHDLKLPPHRGLQWGVASFPEDAESAKSLFLLADNRLRESKRQEETGRTGRRRSARAAMLGLLRIKPVN